MRKNPDGRQIIKVIMRVAFSAPTLDGLADEMSGATTVSKIELNDATLKS